MVQGVAAPNMAVTTLGSKESEVQTLRVAAMGGGAREMAGLALVILAEAGLALVAWEVGDLAQVSRAATSVVVEMVAETT